MAQYKFNPFTGQMEYDYGAPISVNAPAAPAFGQRSGNVGTFVGTGTSSPFNRRASASLIAESTPATGYEWLTPSGDPLKRPGLQGGPPNFPLEGFDPKLRNIFDFGRTEAIRAEEQQQAAVDAALQRLTDALGTIGGIYDKRNVFIDALRNPFSDELVTQRTDLAEDEILRSMQDALGISGANRSGRGIFGGGQASGATALLQGLALQNQQTAREGIRSSQLSINQQANQGAEALANQLALERMGLEGRIGGLQSSIERSNVIDPTLLMGLASDITQAQFGLDFQEELKNLTQEQIDALNPSGLGAFLDTVSQMLIGLGSQGAPNLAVAGLGVGGINSIFSDFFRSF